MSGMTEVNTRPLVYALNTLTSTANQVMKELDCDANKPSHTSKDPAAITRPDKTTVYVRVVFLKLGEIETVEERFAADAFIQARWREPALDGMHKNTDMDLIDREHYWDPLLYLDNISDSKESIWAVVSYDLNGEATVYQRRRVKGTFFEKMELMDYPFDSQDLTLVISTQRGEHEVQLEADPSEISTVNVQSFVEEQEWFLHKHVRCWQNVTTNAYENSKYKHPILSVSCVASRRAQFFVWNVIIVMFFLCSLIFTTFTVNRELVQNRLQLSFILLLSTITFKLAVRQTLPKVSYLTFLDKYILTCQLLMCLVCVWHAIVAELQPDDAEANPDEDDRALVADKVALGVLGGAYILHNIIFMTSAARMVRHKTRQHKIKDDEQQLKIDQLAGRGSRLLSRIVPL